MKQGQSCFHVYLVSLQVQPVLPHHGPCLTPTGFWWNHRTWPCHSPAMWRRVNSTKLPENDPPPPLHCYFHSLVVHPVSSTAESPVDQSTLLVQTVRTNHFPCVPVLFSVSAINLRCLGWAYHVEICLRNNGFQLFALFSINNSIQNHINRAVHIFFKKLLEDFFLLKYKEHLWPHALRIYRCRNVFFFFFNRTLLCVVVTHFCQYGVYRRFLGSTNTIPQRETVAGEAYCRSPTCGDDNLRLITHKLKKMASWEQAWCRLSRQTSKSKAQWPCKRIRSPFARVRSLLSSMTEFIFSTQSASTSPSNRMYLQIKGHVLL